MTPIPPDIKKIIDADPFYETCSLHGQKGHTCGGRRNTREHAFIYAGKQIQEVWAIIPVCEAGQEVGSFQDSHTMVKNMNKWVALNRATDAELNKFYKATPSYVKERSRLNAIYGPYKRIIPSQMNSVQSSINKTPAPRQEPKKTIWYPISEQDKLMIRELQEFNSDIFDKFMSPFEVISDAIAKEHRVMRKYMDDPHYQNK